jgi:hypothetical protein
LFLADPVLKQFVSDDGSKAALIVRRDDGIFISSSLHMAKRVTASWKPLEPLLQQ